MALTTGQRDAVARAFHRMVSSGGESTPYVKSVVRTAVDDVDNWCESAATAIPATSYNAGLNTTFRNNATANQKSLILALVCWWRSGRTIPEGD